MKSGKVWGETVQILSNPFCEVHQLRINAQTRCSNHRHRHKANCFLVLSGTLKIVVEKSDYDLTDETILRAGEHCTVEPGEYHRFEAITDVECLEIYYPPALSKDIERKDCGGGI